MKKKPIKTVRRRTRRTQQIDQISNWMSNHEMADNSRFSQLQASLETLPKKDDHDELARSIAKALDDHRQDIDKKIDPILDIYNGGRFTKSLVLGTAAVIGSIVGIGYGLITIIQWFTHQSS